MAKRKKKVVEATEFHLVDDDGNIKVLLCAREGIPRLSFVNEQGYVAMQLALTDGTNPSIMLCDEEGQERVSVLFDGSLAIINFYDEQTKRRLSIGVGKPEPRYESEAGIEFYHSNGEPRLVVGQNGTGSALVFREAGNLDRLTLAVQESEARITTFLEGEPHESFNI